MSDAFISYCCEHRDKAAKLADLLSATGVTCWWDQDLLPGDQYYDIIKQQLWSARVVVVLWSREASVEGRTWVLGELGIAAKAQTLIPALLDDTPLPLNAHPFAAADLRAVQFRPGEEQVERLIEAVLVKLKRQYNPPSTRARRTSSYGADDDFESAYAAAGRGDRGVKLYSLGRRAQFGTGLPTDLTRARLCYEAAAAHGHVGAMFHLATLLPEPPFKEDGPALRWLRQAAERGHAAAQSNLGQLLLRSGQARDARGWFRRAAQQGHVKAQFNYGLALTKGFGGPKSLPEAGEWLLRAAAAGDSKSGLELAKIAQAAGISAERVLRLLAYVTASTVEERDRASEALRQHGELEPDLA